MTPGEMMTTEVMRSIGGVLKKTARAYGTCTCGHRLSEYALVHRGLESAVAVTPYWSAPWKSQVVLDISIYEAVLTSTV